MIPFLKPAPVGAELPAVVACLRDRRLGPGDEVAKLCADLGRLTGSDHVLCTTSGTQALSVAAIALGLVPGQRVAVPAYGVSSVPNAFLSLGLEIEPVDIDATGNMDAQRLREVVHRVDAVCFVDFSGCLTGREAVHAVCAEAAIPMIEDAACALGRKGGLGHAGTVGDVGCFSFSVPKIVTAGQGGAMLFRDPEVYERARRWIDHGRPDDGVGTNLRITDIQAAMIRAQLPELESRLLTARRVAEVFASRLGERYWGRADPPLHNVVFDEQPDRLIQALSAEGIEARRQYGVIGEGCYPMAEFWAACAVYLPFGPGMRPADAIEVSLATESAMRRPAA